MSVIERERELLLLPPKGAPKPPQSPPTKRDMLHRAADLIEEFGWTQGSQGMPCCHRDGRGQLCYLGAIVQAAYDLGLKCRNGDEMAWAATFTGEDAVNAYSWNDNLRRRPAEVVARLREAADRA